MKRLPNGVKPECLKCGYYITDKGFSKCKCYTPDCPAYKRDKLSKEIKPYAIYELNRNKKVFVDVISVTDVGLAAKWAVEVKKYNGKNIFVGRISLKSLKQKRDLLRRQRSKIDTKIANIAKYV